MIYRWEKKSRREEGIHRRDAENAEKAEEQKSRKQKSRKQKSRRAERLNWGMMMEWQNGGRR